MSRPLPVQALGLRDDSFLEEMFFGATVLSQVIPSIRDGIIGSIRGGIIVEKGQYNLLGGMSYLLENFHYATGDDYYSHWLARDRRTKIGLKDKAAARWFDSAGMFGILYGPILPVIAVMGLNPFVDTISSPAGGVEVDSYRGWSYYSNAGDYIDIGQYYLLDKAQYYYLDKWQYKLLGGANYILGHPCYPLWYHYDFCSTCKGLPEKNWKAQRTWCRRGQFLQKGYDF